MRLSNAFKLLPAWLMYRPADKLVTFNRMLQQAKLAFIPTSRILARAMNLARVYSKKIVQYIPITQTYFLSEFNETWLS